MARVRMRWSRGVEDGTWAPVGSRRNGSSDGSAASELLGGHRRFLETLRATLEVAAAGGHNILIVGLQDPPPPLALQWRPSALDAFLTGNTDVTPAPSP